jgi:hypothetical protein
VRKKRSYGRNLYKENAKKEEESVTKKNFK